MSLLLGVEVEEALVVADRGDLGSDLCERWARECRTGRGAPLQRPLEGAVRAAVGGERCGADRLDVLALVLLGKIGEPVESFLSRASQRLEQQLPELRGVRADLGGAGEEPPGLARGVKDAVLGFQRRITGRSFSSLWE